MKNAIQLLFVGAVLMTTACNNNTNSDSGTETGNPAHVAPNSDQPIGDSLSTSEPSDTLQMVNYSDSLSETEE